MPPRQELTINADYANIQAYEPNNGNTTTLNENLYMDYAPIRILPERIIPPIAIRGTSNTTDKFQELVEKFDNLKQSIYKIITEYTKIDITEEEFMRIIEEGENK